MQNVKWHIGCSGFSYKEWRNEFYPKGLPSNKWFAYYCQYFNTIELNVTFYRFPTPSILEGWYNKAPETFIFSAKVPKAITHIKKFNDTHQMMQDFYTILQQGLHDKLGCVLFQLPPSFVYSQDNLQAVLAHINPSFKNVIEFRHESWWRPDVMNELTAHNISFCGVSFPKISFDDAVVNTSTTYYRFHGVPKLFYSEYDETFLTKIYQQIKGDNVSDEAFIYFNNTASLAALTNARYFQKLAISPS